MASIEGQNLAVNATVQIVSVNNRMTSQTVANDGATSVYLRSRIASTFAGDDAALKALKAVVLKAGERLILDPPVPDFFLACATGQTSTVRILPGSLS